MQGSFAQSASMIQSRQETEEETQESSAGPYNRFPSTSRMDTSLFKAYLSLVKEEDDNLSDFDCDRNGES